MNNIKRKYQELATFVRESLILPGAGVGPFQLNPFYKAEAIYGDIGWMLVGAEGDAGYFFVLAGKDKGLLISYTEIAGGGAPEAGFGIETGRVDYTGDISNFEFEFLEGFRRKIWLGGGDGVGASGAFSWSKPAGANGWIFGTSVQLGIGVSTPITGGYNEGKIGF